MTDGALLSLIGTAGIFWLFVHYLRICLLRVSWEEKEVYDFHLTAEKIEAQRSSVICPMSKSWDLNPSHLRNLTPPSITLLHISPEGPATLGVQRLCLPLINPDVATPTSFGILLPLTKSEVWSDLFPLCSLPLAVSVFGSLCYLCGIPAFCVCACVCVWYGGWLWGGGRREAAEWLTSRETGVTRGEELAQGPGSGSMPPRYPQSRDTRLKTLKVCYPKELNDIRMRHIYAPQSNIEIIIAVTTSGNSNRHN